MKRSLLTLILIIICESILHSQNENNIWYFGQHAGVDFNSGTPVYLLDGEISTDEGNATVCNSEGELLFYSDGVSVWNNYTRLHQTAQA